MRMMKEGALKANNKEAPKTAKVGGVSMEDKMIQLVQDLQKQMDNSQTNMQQMSTVHQGQFKDQSVMDAIGTMPHIALIL